MQCLEETTLKVYGSKLSLLNHENKVCCHVLLCDGLKLAGVSCLLSCYCALTHAGFGTVGSW